MESLLKINKLLRVFSVIGFLLSAYAYIVEMKKEFDEAYSALCDINEHMSCSRVFTSKYGRGFGLVNRFVGYESVFNQPNSIGGMSFYFLIIYLSYSDTLRMTKIMIIVSILSNICSVYLAYVLYFILSDFCIVCISTYIVNAIILALAVMKLNKLFPRAAEMTDEKSDCQSE